LPAMFPHCYVYVQYNFSSTAVLCVYIIFIILCAKLSGAV